MEGSTLLKGNIRRELIGLALPLLLSNILQQFYNTADSLIVARCLGTQAFASTGVSGTLMNLFIFVLNGFCVGISVLFSQAYGRGDAQDFRRNFFHALIAGNALTVLLALAGICFLDPALTLLRTPAELMGYCRTYLRVILLGLPATYFYNFLATVLRSTGATRVSLAFLALSVGANILLDLLFVGAFRGGLAGAAGATMLAQALSALLCYRYLHRHCTGLICKREDMVLHPAVLSRMLRFGLVSALHQSSLYLGKILVQGAVNTLGTSGIAAYAAAMRIEGLVNSLGDSGAQALTIFVSQNEGAGKRERVGEGFRKGLVLMVLLGIASSAMLFLLAPACLQLFLDSADALAVTYGTTYLRGVAACYVLCFIGNVFLGCFRGVGLVMLSFWGTTLQLLLRVILSWRLVDTLQLSAVALATGAGWGLVVIYYVIAAGVVPALQRQRSAGEGLLHAR